MPSLFRTLTIAAVAAVLLQLTACSTHVLSPPTGTIEATAGMRAANMTPAAVGTFKVVAGKADMDKGTTIRASSVGTTGGSFAQYLGETLKADLQFAGLLDPASTTVISGTLTDSDVDCAIGTATARLAARFVVTRDNVVRFDRELKVKDSWESSFMGAIAIPMAARQYEGMYRKLIDALLLDPEFRAAVAKK